MPERWDAGARKTLATGGLAGNEAIILKTEGKMREPEQIRQDCVRKLRGVETSAHFDAILGCLLDEDWTTPRILELQLTPDHHLLARVEGEVTFRHHLGAEDDLIRNIHGIAKVAGLDGDELGFLLAAVAKIKRQG